MTRFVPILITFSLLIGCNSDDTTAPPPPVVDLINYLQVIKNPSGYAPLTAKIWVETSSNVRARIRVIGRHGDDSDIVHQFPKFGTQLEMPVLGLYGDYENQVEVTFLDGNGLELETRNVAIQTEALIPEMPQVVIEVSNQEGIKPGYNFVNYFGHAGKFFPQRAFMFDEFGDIRWFLDYTNHPTLSSLFYDNGMVQLQNGNLAFGDGNTRFIYEIDKLGEIQDSWTLYDYGFHHTVIEMPNGNFLVTVNDLSKPTREDVILEIDRNSKSIVNTWDLTVSLDKSRRTWETDLANLDVDWFHANGLVYSPGDNSVIVSGRTQGVVKLSQNNQVIWILAPHIGWATSGNGTDLNQFLLTPLDAQGIPITDQLVLEGEENHPDFEWAWYQHSPILLSNGNLMVFDNGENRNFSGTGSYSRAVEFEIDEVSMTVKQVWSYGKDRGMETYSRIVSKVVHHEDEGNILFAPGAINVNGAHGKIVEVDKMTAQVLFEAKIIAPIAPFITFHSAFKMELYD